MNVTLVTQTLSNESFNISAVNPESGNSHYSPVGKTLLVIVATFLSLVTVVGNIMVMISFKIDKQLQTISNYFLFSLAVADFAIGLFSMPLFTVYNVLGYWPLGPHICDTWLALDYLASNASVLNLLIISFDRYFSVTRPLTYRAKRTTYKAGIMIACAWGISLLLWPPWIYAWPYIEGQRTVQGNECYIQFLETNHYITFGTAIAAFYIPVSVMIFLYWRIWRETEKRQKDLPNLQAGNQDASKRSNSSDEALDLDECRRPRSESSTGADELNTHFAVSYLDRHYPQHKMKHRPFSWTWLKMWCVAWWHSGREDEDDEDDIGGPESSKAGCEETLTPISAETPITATESRCPSLSVIQATSLPLDKVTATAVELNSDYKTTTRTAGNDSVYTILIRLPTKEDGGRFGNEGPSIKMYHDEVMTFSVHNAVEGRHQDKGKVLNLETSLASPSSIIRRPSHIPDIRIPLNARNVPKTLTTGGGNKGIGSKPPVKKKKKTQEKKADKKAAKTLSAILLAFIITWTPYNILVLLKPLAACTDCIPQEMWDLCYYLCYINSTVNPVCYALCNANFRRTYVRILTCKWHSRNRTAMNRGY
ncbi:muscarinic acetylcholine receptor DM1 isoform X1 [Leptopilina boulardi]|uniref:muscarinic acetylcholine receptor DM1 isoform X1 n=1 Tax=Leptopilina boulardi TaxID=63433 RepID=UPI0021F62450|nr:muscarinic acetylcholine receptor DM1 isoform X1 [Leptopilina boulardi]